MDIMVEIKPIGELFKEGKYMECQAIWIIG
jgi:hypothetical protein